jgi:hypothetical protein
MSVGVGSSVVETGVAGGASILRQRIARNSSMLARIGGMS